MSLIRPVTLRVKPEVVTRFSAEARRAFPNECLAWLLGTRRGHEVEIDAFVLAEASRVTPESFLVSQDAQAEAYLAAREEGLDIVGDIHSHPFRYEEWKNWHHDFREENLWPSHYDWLGRQGYFWITGIVRVLEHESGRKTTKTAFYGPLTPVKVR